MNVDEFIRECEEIFDKKLKPAQLPAYRGKLQRFSSEQLLEILNKVLEEARGFPRVSEIFKCAESLGFTSQDLLSVRFHRWKVTNCGLCRGEGRIAIIWHCFNEERDTGLVEIQELVDVFPYSKSFDRRLGANEYRSVFRCKCFAGEAETLPKMYPRWSDKSEVRRQVWL